MDRTADRSGVVVAAVPLVLVTTLGAVQGGYRPDAWVWAGALAAWASAVALVVGASPGALRRGWPWALASLALLLWTLLSTLWSAHASQSILEARRMLVYAAVVLALLLLARRSATQSLVFASHAAISSLLLYAFLRYLLDGRRHDEFELFTLSRPVCYANAFGILATLGMLLALGIVAGRGRIPARAAAAASVPVLAATLQLTGSTASWLALGAGIAVSVLVSTTPLRLVAALAAVGPGAAVATGAAWYSRYSEATPAPPRISGGAIVAIALGGALAAALLVWRVRLPAGSVTGRNVRRLVLVAVVAVALGGAAAVAHSGATEPRASYFHVAWHDEYVRHPFLGTGAGTFGGYWLRFGKPLQYGGALDTHSLYLETLAELGPVGLLLLLAMLLAPLRGAIGRRRSPYLAAALGAYAAFLVHAGLDWDWEMPAVVVAALCCAGAVAVAELEAEPPLGARTRAAVLAVALVLGGCAIAGARSTTVPEAAPRTPKAPLGGAFDETHV